MESVLTRVMTKELRGAVTENKEVCSKFVARIFFARLDYFEYFAEASTASTVRELLEITPPPPAGPKFHPILS